MGQTYTVASAADNVSAIASLILAVGAVGTTIGALFTYRRAKRLEAARWIQGLFREFYLNDRFRNLKQVIQYDFAEQLAPLLERRLTNRDIVTTRNERKLLEDVDILLNYFEQLLYLEDNNQLRRDDLEAFFNYWFELIRSGPHGSLRRYIAVWDFELIARFLGVPRYECVAVYGSLMSGFESPDAPPIRGDLQPHPIPCKIPGQLFDIGTGYPALVAGDGLVTGELYVVKEVLPKQPAQALFGKLDQYEKYNASDRTSSLYLRRVVRLAEPDVDAWVYIYNQDVSGGARIESGDWRAYRAQPRT